MEIDLGQEIVFKVKLGDQSYELREPSVLEMANFQRQLADSKDEGLSEIIPLLVSLGMPKEVCEKLGVNKMNILISGLMGGLTEKK